MQNNKKLLIIIMFVLIICIIIVTICLLVLQKEKKMEEDNPLTLAFEDTDVINSPVLFFQIDSNINKYMNYVTLNNVEAINALSPQLAIKLDNKQYIAFNSEQMYIIDKIDNVTVFVNGKARQRSIEEDYYLIINIDYTNSTYEIIASSEEEFENAKNNLVDEEYKKNILIEKNNYNKFEQNTVTDLQVIKIYFDDYKFKSINKPEEAFNLLDTEYRKKKFDDNLNAYKQYIKNNMEQLQDANIVKHGVTTLENGNKQYIIIDNFDNYYKFIETGINKYKVILDNYTLQTDEETEKYKKLSSQEKAISNIDKVMKLINEKNYSTVYNYLNIEFKNTYFPTLDRFTNYMKQNFFENNIVGKMTVGNQGDNYIVTVPYKEFLSSAAEEKEITFLVRLKEGTNFELSINL